MLLLVTIVVTALAVSGLCSVLEASLLSSNTLKLSQRKDAGQKGAAVLLELKEHRLDDAISAILTWNTIAHTVGAALAGYQAALVFGENWVGLFSGVLTLLILVFTEIIPKTVGAVYANALAGFTGRTIQVMMLPPMKWLLVITRALTRLFSRQHKSTTTRADIRAVVKLATSDGAIAGRDATFVSNILELDEITARDVMTPRTVITMFEADQNFEDVVESPTSIAFSRFPVFENTRDNIIGYVLQRDLLRASIESSDKEIPLSEFIRPLLRVDEAATVGDTLKNLTADNEHIAVVTDEFGTPTGLVTMEDLFETALGMEIVDELDETVDMRQKAMELREQRLHRLKRIHSGKV